MEVVLDHTQASHDPFSVQAQIPAIFRLSREIGLHTFQIGFPGHPPFAAEPIRCGLLPFRCLPQRDIPVWPHSFTVVLFSFGVPLREDSSPDVLPDDPVRHLIQDLGPQPGSLLPSIDGCCSHPVLLPVASAVGIVQEQRLKIVHGVGVPGFRRSSLLKLVEKRSQLHFLIFRQNREYPLLCRVLPGLLGLQSFRIVGIGIPRVDLHQVMDQTHEHDPGNIHLLVGILPQQIGHDRHMPGVLRVVLPAPVTGEMRLPQHVLFLVDLQRKGQLFLQAFVRSVHPLRSSRLCRYDRLFSV